METTIPHSTDAPFDATAIGRAATVTVKVVYLARLRDAFARADEALVVAATSRVADVLDALRSRGGRYAAELAPGRAVRVAVNHVMARNDGVLRDGDEVALLPPVTGG